MWVIVNQLPADVFREGRIDEAEENDTEESVMKESVTVGRIPKGSITEENDTVGRIPEERVIEERHHL